MKSRRRAMWGVAITVCVVVSVSGGSSMAVAGGSGWRVGSGVNLEVYQVGTSPNGVLVGSFTAYRPPEYFTAMLSNTRGILSGKHPLLARKGVASSRTFADAGDPKQVYRAWDGEMCVRTKRALGNRVTVTVQIKARYVPVDMFHDHKKRGAVPPKEHMREAANDFEFTTTPRCVISRDGEDIDVWSPLGTLPEFCEDVLFAPREC